MISSWVSREDRRLPRPRSQATSRATYIPIETGVVLYVLRVYLLFLKEEGRLPYNECDTLCPKPKAVEPEKLLCRSEVTVVLFFGEIIPSAVFTGPEPRASRSHSSTLNLKPYKPYKPFKP